MSSYSSEMYGQLNAFLHRPKPFSVYTAPQLWTHSHVSRQMLLAHLDPNSDLASHRPSYIDASVEWIDQLVGLQGKRLCDLGCGPGLYAARFHDKGALVTGLDISETSLSHAISVARESGQSITYVNADYTKIALPEEMDIYTLIFQDFCVLSPLQRASLLSSIRAALVPGGHLVMDVSTLSAFESFKEREVVADRLMDGFWSAGEYVGLLKSFKYQKQKVSLERYLIVEPDQHWEIYNWMQYFSQDSLECELRAAGFKLKEIAGSLTGEPMAQGSMSFGVIAINE